MKFFVAVLLAACVIPQVNANTMKVSLQQPSWLKDMQVLNCRFGACVNETTGHVDYDLGIKDGYTVIFPDYTDDEVRAIQPELMEYIRLNGIPHQ